MNGEVTCGRCGVRWDEHHEVEMRRGLFKIPLCDDEYGRWVRGRDPFEHLRRGDDEEPRVRGQETLRDEAGRDGCGDGTDEEGSEKE